MTHRSLPSREERKRIHEVIVDIERNRPWKICETKVSTAYEDPHLIIIVTVPKRRYVKECHQFFNMLYPDINIRCEEPDVIIRYDL